MHRDRWWQAPWGVSKTVWQGAHIKNGKLYRNSTCLENQHQKLAINVSELLGWLGRKEAAVATSTEECEALAGKTAGRERLGLSLHPAARSPEEPPAPVRTAPATPPVAPLTDETPKKERKKRQPIHDWGAAIRFVEQEWEKHGDPDLPENRIKDKWESDSDIAERVIEYLQTLDPERDPPVHRSVTRRLKPELERLRAENGQSELLS